MKSVLILTLACAEIGLAAHGQSTNMAMPLTLDEAKVIALHNHPQVAAADYRTLASKEVLTETRSAYFPDANLYGDAVGASSEDARILAGGLNNPTVYNRLAGGATVSQLITDFGHTYNLAASSKYQLKAAALNADATREQVLLGVAVNYLGALQAQAILQVAQQTLATRQLLSDQVSMLASNKLKSTLDVSFAQVAVQESELMVEKASNDAAASMAMLSTALGYATLHIFDLREDGPQFIPHSQPLDDSSLVQEALVQRPELLSLRSQNQSAFSFAKAQRDARLPTLSAFGTLGSSPLHDYHLPNDYAVGGLELSFPLFAGGYYLAKQHEAEYRAKADAELVRNLEDDIVRDVHIAWLNVNNAFEEIKTTAELVQTSTQAYDLADARYKVGSSSIVELSEAQLNLTSAQISDTNAHYNLLIQQANLQYQLGLMN